MTPLIKQRIEQMRRRDVILEQCEQYDTHRRALEAAYDVDELTADVKRIKK